MAADDLLSINDVARLWGTGLSVVVDLVLNGSLRSLDRGLLVAEGRYDIPLIRRSWAEALQLDSPGATRTLTPPPGMSFHPALAAAFDFHKALDLRDANATYAVSSAASTAGRTPEALLGAWLAVASHLVERNAGVGTTIYSLAPIEAVAARVLAEAPTMPRAVSKPTPATLVDVIPLVEEGGAWKVDLPLFERRGDWIQLLTAPLPDESSPSPGSSVASSGADG